MVSLKTNNDVSSHEKTLSKEKGGQREGSEALATRASPGRYLARRKTRTAAALPQQGALPIPLVCHQRFAGRTAASDGRVRQK